MTQAPEYTECPDPDEGGALEPCGLIGFPINARALAPRTNMRSPYRLGIYLLSNLISKREILRKQNRQLGAANGLDPIPNNRSHRELHALTGLTA